MTEITLTAVGWDHPRCMAPMRAAAEAWRRVAPAVSIDWVARPLEAFNDEPIEELATRHDLLVVDHPFAGTAAATGCLAPFDDLLPGATLEALAAEAIGPSHRSYDFAGRQWALAVDAACQVGAVRDDLLDAVGLAAPTTWDEVRSLAEALPGRLALPLYPTDAICSLLSLLANAGAKAPAEESFFPEPEVGVQALRLLAELVPHLHPGSFAFNPPRALDRMRDTDEIVAIPLAFGYTNYSRAGGNRSRTLRFVDVPSSGLGPVGSVLGGAGLAVSSTSPHRAEAAAFAAWACSSEIQAGVIFPAGGQPASRSAWLDPGLDESSGRFFSGTRASIETASVRPRDAWWPRFQESAGHLVALGLAERKPTEATVAELERMYRRHRERQPAVLGIG